MRSFDSRILKIKDRLGSIPFSCDEPMSGYTFFRIGGRAQLVISPRSEKELIEAFAVCRGEGVEPLAIGNGTNLLIADEGLELCVIHTKPGLSEIKQTGECEITVGAGALLSHAAVFACERGLSGMEFAHGIPGSVGGAVYMNAGAYGGEMKDIVVSSRVLGKDGTVYELRGDEHDFSYRHSAVSEGGGIVLSSVLRLSKGDSAAIRGKMDELMAKRTASQPLNYPSAGSTFKRPRGGYAAALIDGAGLKGLTVGGAQVSEKHAGFIINKGGATYKDVTALIAEVQRRVFEASGIMLEPEVEIITSVR